MCPFWNEYVQLYMRGDFVENKQKLNSTYREISRDRRLVLFRPGI